MPVYPHLLQVCRVTGAPVATDIYPAFTEQYDGVSAFRDREACFVYEPNSFPLALKKYLCRLIGSRAGAPLYATAFAGGSSDLPDHVQFLIPDDPEDPLIIPGVRGADGTIGRDGLQGPMILPDDPEEPFLIQGQKGDTGTTGNQGVPGPMILPDDPEEPIVITPGNGGDVSYDSITTHKVTISQKYDGDTALVILRFTDSGTPTGYYWELKNAAGTQVFNKKSVDGTDTFNKYDVQTTPTPAIVLQNPTTSLVGTQVQYSPFFRLGTHVWDTDDAVDKTFDVQTGVIPASGATPTATYVFQWSNNGGGYVTKFSISDTGKFVAGNGTISQIANGDDGLLVKRQTDSSPTGTGIKITKADGTTPVCQVSVDGPISITPGTNNTVPMYKGVRPTDSSPTTPLFDGYKSDGTTKIFTLDPTGGVWSTPDANNTTGIFSGTRPTDSSPVRPFQKFFKANGTTPLYTVDPDGNVISTPSTNGATLFTGVRPTDTSPTGKFFDYQKADATSIVAMGITGILAFGAGAASNAANSSLNALMPKSADIASAATIDLSTATGTYIKITGSTGPVTSLGTVVAGAVYVLYFASTPTLTHNATSLILPGGANITAAAGDMAIALSEGSGNWRLWYAKADGTAVVASTVTVSRVVMTSAQSLTNTLADISDGTHSLNFAIGSGETWDFEFILNLESATSGCQFTITGPSAPTAVSIEIVGTGTSGVVTNTDRQTAFSSTSSTYCANTTGMVRISGCIINGSNSGTVQLRGMYLGLMGSQSINSGSRLNGAWRH